MWLKTPTARQLAVLAVTLLTVVLFSTVAQLQVNRLRELHVNDIERNRKNSLQLARIQSALNQLGLTMRDLGEQAEPYPMQGYRPQFDRLRADLLDALETEKETAPPNRDIGQQAALRAAFERFWQETNTLWVLAGEGHEEKARALIRTRLEAEQGTMSTLVSRLLVQNNESEDAAIQQIEVIYRGAARSLWGVLLAGLIGIVATSLYVIRVDQRFIERIEELGEQRKTLASKVISVQEDTFRTLSRELHDEFGQVLTAVGAMLQRISNRLPENHPAREDLREVRQIANETLEKARSLSQMLHPPILDDYGLAKSIDWYVKKYAAQTGLDISFSIAGGERWIGDQIAIHVYRILQEALHNVVRHSGVNKAWVSVNIMPRELELVVEDHGRGLPEKSSDTGIGLIAMRERAEMIDGLLEFSRPPEGGTRVTVRVSLTED